MKMNWYMTYVSVIRNDYNEWSNGNGRGFRRQSVIWLVILRDEHADDQRTVKKSESNKVIK